jgi:hypothetical protein
MTSWQARMLLGAPFVAGERNVILLHGWNSSPWDGCQLQLAAAMSAHYDNVLTYAYPSALDIAGNARWLRDELRRVHPGTTFDMIGFSEGGLIARAAIEPGALNDNDAIASTANVFLIATPNLGLPAGLPPSPMGDVASRQMADGSDLPMRRATTPSRAMQSAARATASWHSGAHSATARSRLPVLPWCRCRMHPAAV